MFQQLEKILLSFMLESISKLLLVLHSHINAGQDQA